MLRSSLFSNNLSSFVFLACGQLRFKWVTWCVSWTTSFRFWL
ncbi:unnamed protein product [Brassica oleracea var. botrytis]